MSFLYTMPCSTSPKEFGSRRLLLDLHSRYLFCPFIFTFYRIVESLSYYPDSLSQSLLAFHGSQLRPCTTPISPPLTAATSWILTSTIWLLKQAQRGAGSWQWRTFQACLNCITRSNHPCSSVSKVGEHSKPACLLCFGP